MKKNTKVSETSMVLIQKLVKESWENPEFKNRLIKDPLSTIEKIAGKQADLSRYKNIVVEDQTDSSVIYFNIPVQPNLDELELTESQLEGVAGGITPTFVVAGLVVAGFTGTWALDQVF